jgi:ABC-type lipoprotein release transport system permease subunit
MSEHLQYVRDGLRQMRKSPGFTAAAVGQTMKSVLCGVSAIDLAVFSGVAIVLLFSALLACYIPARRAARVDPTVALRYE